MAGIKDQENIEELRKRLYERGQGPTHLNRHKLSGAEPVDVARGWAGMSDMLPKQPQRPATPPPVSSQVTAQSTEPAVAIAGDQPSSQTKLDTPAVVYENTPTILAPEEPTPTPAPKKKRFRLFVILGSFLIFILTALATSVYLFFGANQISANNINLTLNAPFSIPGGEVASLQLSLVNQNSVAIENVTITLNYPSGTRASDEAGREVFEERIPIASVGAGEAINLPIKVILSGEENEDKTIKASIEYRVSGSDGLFFREATPQVVKISSSPLVMRVLSSERISSGQLLEVKLQLRSNATTPQRNILISASYPSTFSFVRSTPDASYAQNGWLVDEVLPEQTYELTLVGKVQGLVDDTGEIQFSAGNPRTDNQFIMGAVLAQARSAYTIERPYTNVAISINGDSDGEAVLGSGQEAEVTVSVQNTLTTPLYGMRVEIKTEGNLIRSGSVTSARGTYDPANQRVLFNQSDISSNLERIQPDTSHNFVFAVKSDPKQMTAAFTVTANIYARREANERAPEVLVGTALAQVKYSSVVEVAGQAGYNDGPFTDSGAVPPVAGLSTTYTITLRATGGSNDATAVTLTTSLPSHVNWLNRTAGDGVLTYDADSKQVRWNIGDITSQASKMAQFQVTLLPSQAQVGRTVILVDAPALRATDRFTGVQLTATGQEIYTELSTEAGFVSGNGVIQPTN